MSETKTENQEIRISRNDGLKWVATHADGKTVELDLDPNLTPREVAAKVVEDSQHFPEVPHKRIFVNDVRLSTLKWETFTDAKARPVEDNPFDGCLTPKPVIDRLTEKVPAPTEDNPERQVYSNRANSAVEAAIILVDSRQDQPKPEGSKVGMGFSPADKRVGAYYAAWIKGESGPNKQGNRLTGRHLSRARKLAKKYKAQIVAELKAEAARKAA